MLDAVTNTPSVEAVPDVNVTGQTPELVSPEAVSSDVTPPAVTGVVIPANQTPQGPPMKSEKETTGPRMSAEGEECNGSLPPAYAKLCQPGLVCARKVNMPGAGGICRQDDKAEKRAVGASVPQPVESSKPETVDVNNTAEASSPDTSIQMEHADMKHQSLLEVLSGRVQVVAKRMTVRQLVDTMNAYVSLKFFPDNKTMTTISARCESLASAMEAHDLASVLTAFVRLKQRLRDSLLGALTQRMEQVAPEMVVGDLVQVFQALTGLHMVIKDKSSLWTALETQVAAEAHKMNPHQVAVILDVLAEMEHRPNRNMMSAVGLRVQEVAPQMEAQDVADTLSVYAKLMLHPGELLLQALLLRAEEVAPEMDAKEVAGTLNAYARLEQDPDATWAKPTPNP